MNNLNGPSIEDQEAWIEELRDRHQTPMPIWEVARISHDAAICDERKTRREAWETAISLAIRVFLERCKITHEEIEKIQSEWYDKIQPVCAVGEEDYLAVQIHSLMVEKLFDAISHEEQRQPT